MDEQAIKSLVRQVVTRVLGEGDSPERKFVVDEDMVRGMPASSTQQLPQHAIITPLAQQAALERKITLNRQDSTAARQNSVGKRTIAIGADHGGYNLKEQLKKHLGDGYTIADCGCHSTDSVDYPDFAYAVAQLVASGQAACGIIIDGAGIGSCMAANKVPGVRAAMCYDQATAFNSREHNNANVLTLGAGLIGPNLAKQIVDTWLNTDFAGGRHQRRVDKIDAIGERFYR